MFTTKCKTCGNTLIKKDYRKYGFLSILSGIVLFPVLFFVAYGTLVPFIYLIIMLFFGGYFILKKERYFYFCKRCQEKFYFKNSGG